MYPVFKDTNECENVSVAADREEDCERERNE